MTSRKPTKEPSTRTEQNEYIPSFISKKPFYVSDDTTHVGSASASGDYLEHQRLQQADTTSQSWYERGRKLGPAATKFRRGACENCGAMTHKTKECLSRPRKHGARWTGKDIQADEVIQDVKLGYDAKRDRWNGYDPREYEETVREFAEMEELRRQLKGDEGNESGVLGEDTTAEGGKKEEGDRYEEETDMGRQQSTSTRNLRIREDTAKYLLNLDLDSAKYDPKTRSMVDSGATEDKAAALVAEEGFMKMSGDAAEFEKATRAAWEMQERGDKNKIHMQANPTEGELIRRKQKEEEELKKSQSAKKLLEAYGGQDQWKKDSANDVGVTESDRYVEYDERGVIKGAKKVKAKSQYPEDVMINNHTSVWGSWWRNFQWGYACCHSTMKNSYCTGEEGKRAIEAEGEGPMANPSADNAEAETETKVVPKEIAWREEEALEEHIPNGVEADGVPVKSQSSQRKRTLKEMRDGVSELEIDEYRRKKVSADDPMKNMLGKDELVH